MPLVLLVRLSLSTCLRHKHDAFVPTMCHQPRSHHSIPDYSSSAIEVFHHPVGVDDSSTNRLGSVVVSTPFIELGMPRVRSPVRPIFSLPTHPSLSSLGQCPLYSSAGTSQSSGNGNIITTLRAPTFSTIPSTSAVNGPVNYCDARNRESSL
jgi:hypothetical protein